MFIVSADALTDAFFYEIIIIDYDSLLYTRDETNL